MFRWVLALMAHFNDSKAEEQIGSIDDKGYRPRNARDVYYMAFNLRQVLVPDLVPQVLDHAEYWIKDSHVCEDTVSYDQHSSRGPYINATLSDALGPRSVRKVVFTTTSHDQGWSSYPESHGTYDASWTWFEAQVQLSDSAATTRETRKLCCNVHAQDEYKTHTITWKSDAEDEEERSLVQRLDSQSIISLLPRAMFPGWRNHICRASIDIYVAAVRR